MALEPRAEMIRFCRLAWQRGYMAATDGNFSLRLDGGRILITPAGRSKAVVEGADLVEVDLEGRALAGGRPSAELALHLAAYRARPDIRAVAHAHPPVASALSAAGVELDFSALPEALVGLGSAPTVPYATPGGEELARAVEPFLAGHDALILAHHGTLTLGPDMESAWARTEKLENAAQVLWAARALGGAKPLSLGEQAKLRAMGGHGGPGRLPSESLPPLTERIELVHLPITDEYRVEKRWEDARGQAHLIVDNRDIKRVCLLTLMPDQGFRGVHVHRHKHEGFYVAEGEAAGELVCVKSGERLNLALSVGDRLWIPPGVAHRFFALKPLSFVEFTDRAYDPKDDSPFDFDR